jgi:predicted transposase YbfD/YdcC
LLRRPPSVADSDRGRLSGPHAGQRRNQGNPETAYCLLSKALSPERLGEVVRSHWGVENRLHWVLNR